MHCSVTLGKRIAALASVAIQTEIRKKKNEHKEKKKLNAHVRNETSIKCNKITKCYSDKICDKIR